MTPELTEKQRADILQRIRAGYDLEAAAADVGLDVLVATRDAALMQDVSAAYAIGTSRLRAHALEFALSERDTGTLLRFIDKREAATQAALAKIGKEDPKLNDWLASYGLTSPETKEPVEWFVDLLIRARKLLEEERLLGEAEPSTMAVRRAHEILEAAGYVIARVEVDRAEKHLPSQAPEASLPEPRPAVPAHRDPNHSLASALRAGRATLIGRSSQ